MRDTRDELTWVLRERGVLAPSTRVAVAWRCWLLEFDEVATAQARIGRPRVAWPVAVANQLNDMARAAITGKDAGFADSWTARRPPAKQR